MSSVKVKHREVFHFVHNAILSGEYAVGQKIPTETELAQRFSASRVTVARALRDLEQHGMLIRRRGAGSFVSESPSESKHLLGMINTEAPGVLTTITDVIAKIAQQKGWGLLLGRHPVGNADQIMQEIESTFEQYSKRKVAGVFFSPMNVGPELAGINARIAEALDRRRICVVLLDRDVCDFPQRSKYDLVGIDNVHAGYVATEHLLDLGYRKIAYIRYEFQPSTITARIAGYREALLSHGIQPDPEWIGLGDSTDPVFVQQFMRRVKPEAIVCVNDHEAARLMRTLSTLSIKVPEDVAIVGLDNDMWATFLSVSLTTLRQPCAELASLAMKLMLERIAQPQQSAREICLTCELAVPESSGAKLGRGKANRTAPKKGAAESTP